MAEAVMQAGILCERCAVLNYLPALQEGPVAQVARARP
jgi:hypothetical protein